ncbi:mitogen-activated protein kinase kinase kinase [Ranunculus cassubicifolius]
MPAWWGRKSSNKNTTTTTKDQQQRPTSIRNKEKARSFDETSLMEASKSMPTKTGITNKELIPALMASSSLDSELEKRKKKGHPLPRPSQVHDQGLVLGSGSLSGSSVSSSVSSDEPPSDFGFATQGRGRTETKYRSPTARSPGPESRSPRALSPLHARLSGMNLDSPTGNQENGKSLCHPLPLPPVSPTHQATSPSFRSSDGNESTECSQSTWKKGKLLGRGTFGHVYVGFNSDKGKMCAIKEVRLISDDSNSRECLKQLNQEITLLGQLCHSNIVQYYGSELGEETLSIFLEYVTGGSIHKLLQDYGAFREPVIQSYTRQILLGLAYLHGRNTVHRDIKGANILVGPNGEIKLADFGMAKHITSNTSILSFKGSPYWMAPEVIMNISGYSLAVDIWSLGCTILEMATSKPPWSQFEGVAAIFKIGNSKEIPEIPDHLSNDAKNFLRLCLQRDPSARPTAQQLLDHPFVQDQAAVKIPKMNLVNDVFPSSSDGNYTPSQFDLYNNKANSSSQERERRVKPMARSPREFRKPMDSARLNMSLPVSPTSSPLRQYGPAHRSCFLSPPPNYMLVGQSSYGPSDHLLMSTRHYMNSPFELDIPQLKAQTPGVSPRRRPF